MGSKEDALLRSGDVGDAAHLLQPLDGKPLNWAVTHDLESYMELLRNAATLCGVSYAAV